MKQFNENFVIIALSEILLKKGLINVETFQNIKTACSSDNCTINKNNLI